MKACLQITMMIFLGVISYPRAQAKVDGAAWKSESDKGDDIQVYRSRADVDRILTVTTTKLPATTPEINKKSLSAFMAEMTKSRGETNEMLGHENWHIVKYELTDVPKENTLHLDGTYTEDGKPYDFHEIVYQEKNKHSHYQLSEPRGPASLNEADSMTVLKEAAQP